MTQVSGVPGALLQPLSLGGGGAGASHSGPPSQASTYVWGAPGALSSVCPVNGCPSSGTVMVERWPHRGDRG